MKRYILIGLLVLNATGLFAQIADSAKRKVALQGAVNFRDLGGYATKDGRHVKWGKIYRSADLSKLTDADLAELMRLKITYDVDLRGNQESAQAPDKLNPKTDYILCPAGSDSLNTWMKDITKFKGNQGDSILTSFYSNTTYLAGRYKPFFNKLLTVPDNESLVFHCTAGKDRTGMGAALFLYSLGVPYDTIVNDYLASNYYRQGEAQKSIQGMKMMGINEQVAKDIMSVKKSYLDATFEAIKKKYGSVDQFLHTQLGLTDAQIKTLRQKYTQ